MKKQTITLALLLAVCLSAWAQKEYEIAKPSGKLYLNVNGARIEGYTGNAIVFSNQGTPEEEDERAKGLQALSSSGYTDNTGLGIRVSKRGADVDVNPVGNASRGDVLYIRVPNDVDVVFSNNNSVSADTLLIRGMKGEIEVSTSFNNVVLENNSGPMNIKNVYKNVEATFANDIKGPVSIISVYGHVDVAIPASTKANLTMATSYGKLYAAGDFNVAMLPKAEKEGTTNIVGLPEKLATTLDSGEPMAIPPTPPFPGGGISVAGVFRGMQENMEGTLNGGGIDLILKSTYKNVYLRTN